jgi:4'-phosphopantetheinyl transferase EntD
MIERLLPQVVSCRTARDDEAGARLFPEEAMQLDGAVDSRLREFATGRSCARQALAGLGLAPAPILRGAKREPLWPAGIVGSITHCRGYRAAAVAFNNWHELDNSLVGS